LRRAVGAAAWGVVGSGLGAVGANRVVPGPRCARYLLGDLHLGVGDPRRESFHQDALLAEFIGGTVVDSARRRPTDLVLVGDALDLLEAVSPGHDVTPVEGTRTAVDLGEEAQKLWRVRAAHPDVFAALAEFVRVERARICLVVGNHDHTLVAPSVAAALRGLLGLEGPPAEEKVPVAGYYEDPTCGLYVEHGSQFDWNTRYADFGDVSDAAQSPSDILVKVFWTRVEPLVGRFETVHGVADRLIWLLGHLGRVREHFGEVKRRFGEYVEFVRARPQYRLVRFPGLKLLISLLCCAETPAEEEVAELAASPAFGSLWAADPAFRDGVARLFADLSLPAPEPWDVAPAWGEELAGEARIVPAATFRGPGRATPGQPLSLRRLKYLESLPIREALAVRDLALSDRACLRGRRLGPECRWVVVGHTHSPVDGVPVPYAEGLSYYNTGTWTGAVSLLGHAAAGHRFCAFQCTSRGSVRALGLRSAETALAEAF